MAFIDHVYEKLQRHPKRIVFPDGTNPRVVRTAGEYVRRRLGPAILLGNRNDIVQVADRLGVGLIRVRTIDPKESSDLDQFAAFLQKLPRYKDVPDDEARKIVANPNFFAAMMLQHGHADGAVTGLDSPPTAALRAFLSVVKPLPSQTVAGCFILDCSKLGDGKHPTLFCADCSVIPEPSFEELASVALETARLARQLTGQKPRVALLSYANRGELQTRHTDKIAAATALAQTRAKEQGLDIEVDGELTISAALGAEDDATLPNVNPIGGHANVLIFPTLNSAHLATGLLTEVARPESFGQLLIGLSKPAALVRKSIGVSDLLGVAALAAVQAVAYRILYPDQGVPQRAAEGHVFDLNAP